ncbi:MAG: DUF2798 domain-containing protein [Alphaproteobacteria bacterium]
MVAAIASFPFFRTGTFIVHWLWAWLIGWVTMTPVALLAAPAIRRAVDFVTR